MFRNLVNGVISSNTDAELLDLSINQLICIKSEISRISFSRALNNVLQLELQILVTFAVILGDN